MLQEPLAAGKEGIADRIVLVSPISANTGTIRERKTQTGLEREQGWGETRRDHKARKINRGNRVMNRGRGRERERERNESKKERRDATVTLGRDRPIKKKETF